MSLFFIQYVPKTIPKNKKRKDKYTFLWVAVFILSAYPFLMLINGFFLHILADYIPLPDYVGTLFHGKQRLGQDILFFAIIPGICEEIFFRGVLLQWYRQLGRVSAIFLSGFLFAIFHFNLQNFISPLLLGILLGSIMWWTGSVIYAMEAHIIHNIAGIMFLRSFTPEKIRWLKDLSIIEKIGSVEKSITLGLGILCLLCIFIFYWSFLMLSRGHTQREEYFKIGEPITVLLGFLPLGLIVLYYCIVVFK
ncbi:MAG: CPBP family intramembrane metalloprotease [Tissierellia bacterium]|nr:CPBP family intramembrane metalloprotease [Tissierellia bacterium]